MSRKPGRNRITRCSLLPFKCWRIFKGVFCSFIFLEAEFLSFPLLINKAWPLVNMQAEPNEPCRLL